MRNWLKIQFLVIVLTAYFFTNLVFAEEGYYRWVLDGLPSEARSVEFLHFRLERGPGEKALNLRLSQLLDDWGNEFPREMIVLKTPYDSAYQSWHSLYSQRQVVAAGDEFADFAIGVHYHSPVKAGVYRGQFHSEQGDEIPVEIIVKPYTRLSVEPEKIFINIAEGPGVYYGDQLVLVTVEANHSKWLINLSSSGLSNLADLQKTWTSWDREPESALQLWFIAEEKPATQLMQVSGAAVGEKGVYSFQVMTKADLTHRAGNYIGVISVEVQQND